MPQSRVVNLNEAESLAQFVEMLKAEQGDSYTTLGAKTGIAGSTLHRIINGGKADDETLDKIADYAGVTRAWLYELAKGLPGRPRYSRTVAMLASLLEQAPPEIAEIMLVQARALIKNREKKPAKGDKPADDLGTG